jgi:hypothetical protein
VKTRIQAAQKRKGEKQSVLSLLIRILREEGVSAFYNGFGASMLNTFSMRASLCDSKPANTNSNLQNMRISCSTHS